MGSDWHGLGLVSWLGFCSLDGSCLLFPSATFLCWNNGGQGAWSRRRRATHDRIFFSPFFLLLHSAVRLTSWRRMDGDDPETVCYVCGVWLWFVLAEQSLHRVMLLCIPFRVVGSPGRQPTTLTPLPKSGQQAFTDWPDGESWLGMRGQRRRQHMRGGTVLSSQR